MLEPSGTMEKTAITFDSFQIHHANASASHPPQRTSSRSMRRHLSGRKRAYARNEHVQGEVEPALHTLTTFFVKPTRSTEPNFRDGRMQRASSHGIIPSTMNGE